MLHSQKFVRGMSSVMILVVAGVVLAVLALGFYFGRRTAPAAGDTAFTSHGPTIEKLQELGNLVTLRVHVADVLEGRNTKWWGDVKGVWLVKGDALLGVDMRKAKFVSRDVAARTAVVKLPAPEVLSPRVDHERTKTYEITSDLLRSSEVADALRDQAMQEAQRLIDRAAGQEENVALAKGLTERMLKAFFKEFDWSVEIRWEG